MTDAKKEEKEERDDIDEFLDSLPDTDGDEPDKKDADQDKKDDSAGEDDKPVTIKELKAMLQELKGDTKTGVDADVLKQFKDEIKNELQQQLEPVLKTARASEFKKSVVDWEKKAQDNLPHFEVDMDLLEYHMAIGKSKKEAFTLQVEKERARAERYGSKKEEVTKEEVDDIDLNNFDPELHKDGKAFRKLKEDEKKSYWTKFSSYVKKNRK